MVAMCKDAEPATLIEAAVRVLRTAEAARKRDLTAKFASMWRAGKLAINAASEKKVAVPDRPARQDDKMHVVAPRNMPKLGKGGSLTSRQAILHSLTHIESWAVDLSWDAIARFGRESAYQLPVEFFDDFVRIADDEARHFGLLSDRLQALGCSYGALPVHDGLWESAATTAASLPARLAVEHCLHEARGLDVLPGTIDKLQRGGDSVSAALLRDIVLPEEVTHCAAGVRWLRYLHTLARQRMETCEMIERCCLGDGSGSQAEGMPNAPERPVDSSDAAARAAVACGAACRTTTSRPGQGARRGTGAQRAEQCHDGGVHGERWESDAASWPRVELWFHALIRAHFKGNTKPPFNAEARAAAGFTPAWYLPLSTSSSAMLPAG